MAEGEAVTARVSQKIRRGEGGGTVDGGGVYRDALTHGISGKREGASSGGGKKRRVSLREKSTCVAWFGRMKGLGKEPSPCIQGDGWGETLPRRRELLSPSTKGQFSHFQSSNARVKMTGEQKKESLEISPKRLLGSVMGRSSQYTKE